MSAVSQEKMGQRSSKRPDCVGPLQALERPGSVILSRKSLSGEQHDVFCFRKATLLNQRSSPFNVEKQLGNGIPHPHLTPQFIMYINLCKGCPTVQ